MLTFSVNHDINTVVRKGTIADVRPTSDLGRQWWGEVWLKTLEDRTDDSVNLEAYGYTCERNTTLATARKETALLTPEEVEMGMKGVASTVASYIDQNVDTIVSSSEISTFISEFKQLHEELMTEEGVNLWVVMSRARMGIVPSIEKLRELTAEYDMSETIYGVLANPKCILALEGELNANIFS